MVDKISQLLAKLSTGKLILLVCVSIVIGIVVYVSLTYSILSVQIAGPNKNAGTTLSIRDSGQKEIKRTHAKWTVQLLKKGDYTISLSTEDALSSHSITLESLLPTSLELSAAQSIKNLTAITNIPASDLLPTSDGSYIFLNKKNGAVVKINKEGVYSEIMQPASRIIWTDDNSGYVIQRNNIHQLSANGSISDETKLFDIDLSSTRSITIEKEGDLTHVYYINSTGLYKKTLGEEPELLRQDITDLEISSIQNGTIVLSQDIDGGNTKYSAYKENALSEKLYEAISQKDQYGPAIKISKDGSRFLSLTDGAKYVDSTLKIKDLQNQSVYDTMIKANWAEWIDTQTILYTSTVDDGLWKYIVDEKKSIKLSTLPIDASRPIRAFMANNQIVLQVIRYAGEETILFRLDEKTTAEKVQTIPKTVVSPYCHMFFINANNRLGVYETHQPDTGNTVPGYGRYMCESLIRDSFSEYGIPPDTNVTEFNMPHTITPQFDLIKNTL